MDEWYYIGSNKIHKTCVIGDNVILGENNIIYPYTVVGLPGFIRGRNENIAKVVIGNNNWIGCNVCIMVGEGPDTIIGDDNLIMNYVNIGHNTKIGNKNEIGAGTIIAGWVEIGENNKIKMSVTIRNRKKVLNNSIIGMGSIVVKDVDNNSLIYGNPAEKKNL